MIKRYIIPIFFLVFIVSGCLKDEVVPTEVSPVYFKEEVRAELVRNVDIPIFYEAVGTIKAKTSSVLSSKISGHIKEIYVREGSYVKEGDILLIIDDRDIKARLNQANAGYESARKSLDEIDTGISQATAQKKQAQAELSLAHSNYNRFEILYKENAISEQEFDTTSARLRVIQEKMNGAVEKIGELFAKQETTRALIEQARSGVEGANVMMTFSVIKAPFDGVIVKKHVGVGGLASPGVPLLTIENPSAFRLEVSVREQEFAGQVKVGGNVDIFLDAFGQRRIQGKVVEVVPVANSLSRTFKVKISIPYSKGVKSGMYGKAIYPRGKKEGLLIPETALLKRGQLEQVFFIDKDYFARLRLVKTGKRFGDLLEVLAGLKAGDNIITEIYPNLKEGYKVEVTK